MKRCNQWCVVVTRPQMHGLRAMHVDVQCEKKQDHEGNHSHRTRTDVGQNMTVEWDIGDPDKGVAERVRQPEPPRGGGRASEWFIDQLERELMNRREELELEPELVGVR